MVVFATALLIAFILIMIYALCCIGSRMSRLEEKAEMEKIKNEEIPKAEGVLRDKTGYTISSTNSTGRKENTEEKDNS